MFTGVWVQVQVSVFRYEIDVKYLWSLYTLASFLNPELVTTFTLASLWDSLSLLLSARVLGIHTCRAFYVGPGDPNVCLLQDKCWTDGAIFPDLHLVSVFLFLFF